MGVTGLTKLLRDRKVSSQSVSLKELNSIIKSQTPLVAAIDANNFVHKFLCNREPKCFLNSITTMVHNLIKYNIIPVFVFDGKPLTDKQDELKRRAGQRSVAQKRVEELEVEFTKASSIAEKKQLMGRIISYKNQLVRITNEHVKLVKKLLRIFRLPFIDAPNDAEALACYLNKVGKVDLVITEDSDCLVFGCKYLLRGFSNRKFSGFELFVTKDTREGLGFTQHQMIDLAILLGNDYSGDLIPPAKAHDLLTEFGSIEGIKNNVDEITSRKKFNKWKAKLDLLASGDIDYQRVRNIFNTNYQDIANEFQKPTEFKKFSPKRIKFLQKFLVKHTESKTGVEKLDKIIKFIAK
jgi:5'-3' exonuclease